MISQIPDTEGKKSRVVCTNFEKFRFPGSIQIPFPVKTFCVFPNPAPQFGQVPDPKNTLLDPAGSLDNNFRISLTVL